MTLWLPPGPEQRLLEERLADTARRLEMVEMDPLCVRLTVEFKQFDEWVSIVKAKDHAAAPGIRPGFYHVMRFNQNAPLSFLPIEAPDGGFMVPDSGVLERLRRTDMWNERVVRDRRRALEMEEQAKRADEARDAEERREELTDRWNAASRTHVSMSTDQPWSQNVAGRRKRADQR